IAELFKKIIDSENGEFKGIKLNRIAPFASEEVVSEAFIEAIKKGKDYVSLAPFVDDDVWEEVIKLLKEGYKINLPPLYPFMEDDSLQEIYEMVKSGELKDVNISSLYPFIDDDYLDEMFLKQVKEGKDYVEMAPFVSEECLHKIAEDYVNGDTIIDINCLYPFMDSDDIKMIFKHAMEKDDIE
ncbi:MAG: hypothetical protein PHD50_03825, partial [Bacilli bacterium]|nr:hypothetical protein [Bacilli bacterium]